MFTLEEAAQMMNVKAVKNYCLGMKKHVIPRKLDGRLFFIDSDIEDLTQTCAKHTKKSAHPFFKILSQLILPRSKRSSQLDLLARLKDCQIGKKRWVDYQRLVGEILEQLFCPPLQAPLSESPDISGANRRDFIFPNHTETGFWSIMRKTYGADYVVVDAKNKKSIHKDDVLQIANYLKPHGAGMFSIIATRVGADKAALLTIREQWIIHQKMILVLNDESIKAMLLASSAGTDATKVIVQLIQDFRLSM